MENSIFAQAAKFLHDRRGDRRWRAIVLGLALLVICGTAWGLSKQGQALTHAEEILDCRLEVHEHSEECLDEDGNLICGKADFVFHEHDKSCYNSDKELVCLLPEIEEHVHEDECWAEEEILICTLEEASAEEGAVSGKVTSNEEAASEEETIPEATADPAVNAGEPELICGQEEHTHDAGCYETAAETSYNEETTETEVLICGQDEWEHYHDNSCYEIETVTETSEDGEEKTTETEVLVCGQEEGAHYHNADCYETVTETSYNEETTETEVLACGREEHTHTGECYSAETADAPSETTDDAGINDAEEDEAEEAHVHTDECYKTVRKLACDQVAEHTHDDSCYDGEENPVCGAQEILRIETHVHDEDCFETDDRDIEFTKTFSNDDVMVTAVYRKSAGIPEDAELTAELITQGSDLNGYKDSVEEVLGEKEALAAVLSQLRFATDDEIIIPESSIKLTVEFLNDNIYTEEDTVKAAHIGEDGAKLVYAEDTEESRSITFKTDELADIAFIVQEENDDHTLVYEGEDYIVKVVLSEDMDVPEDAELVVEEITEESDPEAYDAYIERLKGTEETEGVIGEDEKAALLLDMAIYAGDIEIVSDEAMDVTVQFLNREIYFEGDPVKAAHFTEDNVELLEASVIDEEVSTTFTVDELEGFAFITDANVRTLTAEGEDFIITVRFNDNAKIPETAELSAKRITEESDPEAFAEREDQLQDEIEDKLIAVGALFDICFIDADGTEVEPQDMVDVKIQLLDRSTTEDAEFVDVYHFVEDEENTEERITPIEDAEVSEDGEGSLSTIFQTDSFSLYSIVVDGKVHSESTLRKAIKLAQDLKDDCWVELDADILFGRQADEGDDNGAIPIKKDKMVHLNLNGYTIFVTDKLSVDDKSNVTLFDINGSLEIVDNVDPGRYTEKREVIGMSQDTDTRKYEPEGDFDTDRFHLNSLTYYVTESTVVEPSVGATREELVKYTISGHGAIVGSAGNTDPLLYVPNGGVLIINDGVIVCGNGNRAVELRNTSTGTGQIGTLTLRACYLVGNTANKDDERARKGGAIYASTGVINISEKTIISGNTGRQGGGIYAENSIIHMDGGYITNNMATFNDNGTNYGAGGGGIYLKGAAVYMKGGYITGNTAYSGGGGIALGGAAEEQELITQINKGTISSNYCIGYHGEGGGIALYDESIIEIDYKGSDGQEYGPVYITNNKVNGGADWGGGGLFVGQNSSATLFDTLITDNSAEGFGGGLGGCSTGRIVEVDNSRRGAAIFDNSAAGQTYAGASTKNADYNYAHTTPEFWERDQYGRYYFQDLFSVLYIALENSMLGGGNEHWDGTVDGARVNAYENFWQASYICGLTAFPSEKDKETAKQFAHVYINGNHSAVHGGGIMCNGIMVIGENKGQIEIITAMELTGTKKLLDGDNDIPFQAGQFTFSIYSGNAYAGQHEHHRDDKVYENKNTGVKYVEKSCYDGENLICGLDVGEPVFDNHEHQYLPPSENGTENPNSCYRKISTGSKTDSETASQTDAGGKGYELICNKGIVATGKNGTEEITGTDPDTGNVTTTSYNPQTISFDSLLTFDLQRELGKTKDKIQEGEHYDYYFFIKEDDATEAASNIEIERDRTVYCMVVRVEKQGYGNVGLSNIEKYYDDIVEIKVYRTIKNANGTSWSWENTPVKIYDKKHDDFHAIKINMDDFSDNKAAFTNRKTEITKIEVSKSWDFDYRLDKPDEWKKEDEVEWVSVALFEKGLYDYYDEKYGPDDKDAEGNSLEGQTKPRPGELTEYGRLYLTAANNWTASWENLPDGFPIGEVEVREIDVKYRVEKWVHQYQKDPGPEDYYAGLTLAEKIDPAVWAFVPKYTYTTEGDVAKVVVLNTPKTFGISFTKIGYTDANGDIVGNSKGKNKGAVQGAVFELYCWDWDTKDFSTTPMLFKQGNDGYSFIDEDVVTADRTVRQLSTNINGEINISNLWWGKFLLKEVEAPVGYKPVHDHIIDFEGGTATQKVICVINGKEVVNTPWSLDENGEGIDGTGNVCPVFAELTKQFDTDKNNGSANFDYENDVLKFTMIDPENKYELPETGGDGAPYISILGAVLLLGIATLIYTTYRRRREGLRR